MVKFICSHAGCGESYSLEKIHHHEMFKCLYQNILYHEKSCQFINNVKTVIIHSINSFFIWFTTQYVNHCTMCKFLLIIAMENNLNVQFFRF